MSGMPLLEPSVSSSSSEDRKRRLLRTVVALLLVLFTGSFCYLLLVALGKTPPPRIVSSQRVAVDVDSHPQSPSPYTFPSSQRRSLRGRGGRGGLYPVTSPTNGGQIVSPGVPWAPKTIAEARVTYPPNAIRMQQNGLVGQRKQHNRMQDGVYDRLPVYARLQRRAEDQALVARLQQGLASPTYALLRQRVQQDPQYQYRLQAGLYRRARKYQQMQDRVQDPAYLADLQARLYRSILREGRGRYPEYSVQATAVETRPGRPSHVP